MSITLVIGGARSGKSQFAEKLATDSTLACCYIATATAIDEEMAQRIAHHKTRRPQHWVLRECPLALADLLKTESQQPQTILVDCLTLWLNNQLHTNPNQIFPDLFSSLTNSIQNSKANIIFVTNEVGLGIIPLGEITRQFVDEAGRLNQKIAQIADDVIFMIAGLPLDIKKSSANIKNA
jgi:adenosylcobinamide kinase/adenosylcobinamide-phosphate guanylyltransferase